MAKLGCFLGRAQQTCRFRSESSMVVHSRRHKICAKRYVHAPKNHLVNKSIAHLESTITRPQFDHDVIPQSEKMGPNPHPSLHTFFCCPCWEECINLSPTYLLQKNEKTREIGGAMQNSCTIVDYKGFETADSSSRR